MTAGQIPRRVGIVGAGMAGAACARTLADAGCAVQVFDKSRGVGGRMATRRASWVPEAGAAQPVFFDHGVPWWTAQSSGFARFLAEAQAAGWVQRWEPRQAGAAGALVQRLQGWVGLPDMPALCRFLLREIPVHTECQVSALAPAEARCEWDGQAGLGACGDDLGDRADQGGGGVEVAWLSGCALARRMLGVL